jgi:hypothetical protein
MCGGGHKIDSCGLKCSLCFGLRHTKDKCWKNTCTKLTNTRPKCAKCEGGHKTDNCGLKYSLCFRLKHTEDRCWKKSTKGLHATTNFLEVLVDDEKVTLIELNHVGGREQHISSRVRIPKRRLPIIANLGEKQEKMIAENEQRGVNMGFEVAMKSKILSHFIKGKISLTPMETILIIP